MAPVITLQNVDSADHSRIVKLGDDEFYFDDDWHETHKDIAIKNGVPESDKPVVRDAGFLKKNEAGKYYMEGDTNSCQIEGDPKKAREKSQQRLREILGERAF